MKALRKLSRILGGDGSRRKAQAALAALKPVAFGEHLSSLPTGSIDDVLAILEQYDYPTLSLDRLTRTPREPEESHTIKADVRLRAATERRTRSGVHRESLFITRISRDRWTWYWDASHAHPPGERTNTAE